MINEDDFSIKMRGEENEDDVCVIDDRRTNAPDESCLLSIIMCGNDSCNAK